MHAFKFIDLSLCVFLLCLLCDVFVIKYLLDSKKNTELTISWVRSFL